MVFESENSEQNSFDEGEHVVHRPVDKQGRGRAVQQKQEESGHCEKLRIRLQRFSAGIIKRIRNIDCGHDKRHDVDAA